jgi:hypothetical protein
MQAQPGSSPVVVRVLETPTESTTVADVLIGAFGLIGVLLMLALVLGLLLGGVLIFVKRLRAPNKVEAGAESDAIHISPYA